MKTVICTLIITSLISCISLIRAQCNLAEESYVKELVVNFITNSDWSDVRNEVGLTSASARDIKQISTSYYSYSCNRLSSLLLARYNEYKVHFYKIKDRYITISVIKQPDDPDEVATFLEVFTSSFTRLEGYSF